MPTKPDALTQWREDQLQAGTPVDILFGAIAAELVILGVMRGMTPEQSANRLRDFVAMWQTQQNRSSN